MLQITKQELTSAVQTVIAGSARKSSIDWHDTLLFECTGDSVIIAAGSGSGFAWRSFEASGEPFRVAVNAREISELCSTSRSDTLTITHSGNRLTFLGDRGRLSLACSLTYPEAHGGWPSLPPIPDGSSVTIKAGDLHRAIKATVPVTDENSARYSLGSVQIVKGDGQVMCYATDGRAAVSVEVPATTTGDDSLSLLLPDVGMTVLSGMLRGIGDACSVDVLRSGTHACFVGGGSVVMLSESAGNFPKVGEVLATFSKQATHARLSIVPADLRSALREAVIGYDVGSTTGRTVLLVSDGERLRVLSDALSDNDMDVLVPCHDASGDGGYVRIDHAYLSKLLSAAGDTVDVRLCEGGALLLTNASGFTAVAMGCSIEEANKKRAEDAIRAGAEFLQLV